MASLATCCACQGASCLSNLACSCFGVATDRSSKLARLAYTAIFFMVSLGSWAWYAWGYNLYKDNFPDSVIHVKCPEEKCFGAMSVYRITSVLTFFFLTHAIIALVCHQCKINISAKWWGLKLILLLGGLVTSFFLPNEVFYIWAWIALIGGSVFIILQLILLVEFAHSWSESWVAKWEEDPQKSNWFYGLVAASMSLYTVALALTIAEFIIFTQGDSCKTNFVFIAVNICLILFFTSFSLHPKVQEKNPNSGLLQSAIVAAYTTYLIWSSLMSQPETCNHITDGKESVSAITGAILVFVSVCYSAFRVSTKADVLSLTRSSAAITDLENSKRIDDVDTVRENEVEDDPNFNYTFFHICFTLASCYIAMLITNWMIVQKTSEGEMSDAHYVIDRSIGSMWVKIATSWLAHLLYIWSLVAPVLMPNRIFYEL